MVSVPDRISDVLPSRDRGSLKELRLAVVCYGGVSLAIYMHGVTKEIHKLVAASRGLERSPDQDPFGGRGTESVYWRALKRLAERQGVRTNVVVDIVSGTSAGGINGVYLAKALASNLSQDALREMWMVRGDLNQLIRYPVPTIPLKMLAWVLASAVRGRPRPPLDGDRMLSWLFEALERMDTRRDPVALPDETSLVPEGERLELFVTATDLTGYTRWVWSYSPKQVPDLWHRHVLAFRTDRGAGRLDRAHNQVLAFAARATSCFPGAFAPIAPADVGRVLRPAGWPATFAEEFAPVYGLSGVDVMPAAFIDGGVLDNFPFGHAIEAIARKPAWTEVDRRLLYIEPDPMVPEQPASLPQVAETVAPRTVPGMIRTIWAGLSTIPRHEPILTDLQRIRDRNQRIGEIRDIVDTAHVEIADRVRSLVADRGDPAGEDWAAFSEANRVLSERAAEEAGVAHLSYVRAKLLAVTSRLAAVAAKICSFPDDSNHAAFVREVISGWALREGYLATAPEPTEIQLGFVRAFDLGYRERRIRFVIRAINDLYGALTRDDRARDQHPDRADLDRAKGLLWSYLLELQGIVDAIAAGAPGPAGEIADGVRSLFDRAVLSRILSDRRADTIDTAVQRFIDDRDSSLNTIRGQLQTYLSGELDTFGARLYADFRASIAGWNEAERTDLIVRYLGFPYWDRLIFPLQYVSDVSELNRIEVIRLSPTDVKVLGECSASAKLRGVTRGHFGAFFKREYRENDYLWGRLDAAERLLWMLFDAASSDEDLGTWARVTFGEILEEERGHLTEAEDVIRDIERVLAGELLCFPGCSSTTGPE